MSYGHRYKARKGRPHYSATKELVDGHGPTLLEKIASGVGSVAQLATAIAPIVEAINTESKYYDEQGTYTAYGTATNADLRCITDSIVQGTGDEDRIGNSILAQDISIKIAYTMAATTGTPNVTGGFARIIFFVWKINDSGGPSVSKMLETPTNICSAFNKDYTDQFVIMKDKFISLDTKVLPATGTAATIFGHFKWFKSMKWHLRWDDASNDTSNHVWMLTLATPTSINNGLNVTFYSRLNYTDN